MLVGFTVPFVFGKQRPKFGRGRTYTPRKTVERERAMREAYREASLRRHGRVAKAGEHVPVTIAVSCTMPASKSRPKWWPKALWDRLGGMPFVRVPDADNALKAAQDALNGVAYHDDAQITEAHVFKTLRMRGGREQTHVVVFWNEGQEESA